MKEKKALFVGAVVLMLVATVAFVWAYTPAKDYNRPVPLMDYAPQELGIYDTQYAYLGETDCRICHGNSLVDRHHYSEAAQAGCVLCHAIDPDDPNGVVVTNDCAASGCHDTYDNGWHHLTQESYTDQCIACHDPGLLGKTDFVGFDQYPSSVVTPTPFSCENCHWEQTVMAQQVGFDETIATDHLAGHPSTFNHHDPYEPYSRTGGYYFEYGKPVLSNYDTHHMLFAGNVSTDCVRCHSQDPDNPSWDPANLELIRYCETCHTIGSLHKIEPHVGTGGIVDTPAVNGWEAIGFHLPDVSNTDTTDLAPTDYRVFSANDQCYGCHADLLPDWFPETPADAPAVTGINPKIIPCDSIITITGDYFGNEKTDNRFVVIRPTSGLTWQEVPIVSWTNDEIRIQIPCWVFADGLNYYIRVHTESGNSGINPSAVFALVSSGTLNGISPDTGACREIITLSGTDFGTAQDMNSGGYGIYKLVEFVASQGTYVATNYGAWTNSSFKAQFGDVFEDTNGNYIQDTGEPLIRQCEALGLGVYSVYVRSIYYEDIGAPGYNSGDGDIIHEEKVSDPASFELVTQPVVYLISPAALERTHFCTDGIKNGVIKIYGWGFGSSQGNGKVFIGTKKMWLNNNGVELNRTAWTSTLIKAAVDVPSAAQDKNVYVWVEKDGVKSDASYGYPGVYIMTDTCP
ncbi:MAG: hypothetical protein HWN68_00305 [Desulfobacterales bacterium]|nr:hypothetical protein [Desulfobacterales bacterium]